MEAAMGGAVRLSALRAFFLAFAISSRCSAQQEEQGRAGTHGRAVHCNVQGRAIQYSANGKFQPSGCCVWLQLLFGRLEDKIVQPTFRR
jgi:hypothetical protein